MEITEVRIKLMDGAQDRLLGFCSITIDKSFVVRDLKIIKGTKGSFVAMPSRKLTDRCPNCGSKNYLRAGFCSECGRALGVDRSLKSVDGRAKLYADIAHPINSECRDQIQSCVLDAYDKEVVAAQEPGYVCRYDEFGDFDLEPEDSERWQADAATGENRRVDPPAGESGAGPHAGRPANRAQAQGTDEFGTGIL